MERLTSESVSPWVLRIGIIVLTGIGAFAFRTFAGMATMHDVMLSASVTSFA